MTIKKGDKILPDFEGTNVPEDFDFPSIGIEDIDRAVFELFDKKLNFQITEKGKTKKVPVVFAAGERFALTRRKNPIRDINNTLILPIISIMRGEIDLDVSQGGKKTAIAFREQKSYTIKKRLSKQDRKYQNIVNKFGLTNQDNVAARKNFMSNEVFPGKFANPGTLASRRNGYNLTYTTHGGRINLFPDFGDNIFEIIDIPYPEFVAVTYDVIFWTQYMSQANEIIETLAHSFEGQGSEITMKTDSGFDLVAFFKASISSNSNFDNYTDDERIIKHSISLTVPGYILNPKNPGLPSLVRGYTSAPTIDFTYIEPKSNIVIDEQKETKIENIRKHVLTDIQDTLTYNDKPERGQSSEKIENFIVNPFTGEGEIRYSKVITRNKRSGESVVSLLTVDEIERQYE